MSKAGESFDEVWEKLNADDKTGTFEKAEVLSFISCEALEYAYNSGYETAKAEFERPQGECKTCRHRDPEDKKCDCGELERQGCLFPVSDDYYCKFYEKGGAE